MRPAQPVPSWHPQSGLPVKEPLPASQQSFDQAVVQKVLRRQQLKHFMKAILRSVRKHSRPKPGQSFGKLSKDLMHFQKHVMGKKHHKKRLRQELDVLQEKINKVINKEKYILAVHEKEQDVVKNLQEHVDHVEGTFEKRFTEEEKHLTAIEKDITEMKQALVKKGKKKGKGKKTKKKKVKEVVETTPQQRLLENLEAELKQAEGVYKVFARRKSTPKDKVKKLKGMISRYKKKITKLKKKHVKK